MQKSEVLGLLLLYKAEVISCKIAQSRRRAAKPTICENSRRVSYKYPAR